LIEYGVARERIEVAADLAWLLSPVDKAWGRARLQSWGVPSTDRIIGVNLMNEKKVREESPQLMDAIANFLDHVIESCNGSILFLCNEIHDLPGFDRPAALRVMAAMKHRHRTFLAPNEYWSPQEMMSLIGNCHVTVGMRYHFCLFSAVEKVPFLAIQKSDKIADLCEDFEWLFGAKPAAISANTLTKLFSELDANHSEIVGKMVQRTSAMQNRAWRNLLALQTLHGQGRIS
jgi:polysaccharide pyruvyl transferase WcaK-like protein